MQEHTTDESSVKLCECGCGQPTNIAPHTNKKLGWLKGQPLRFVHGHNRRSTPERQFWKHVQRVPHVECWLWQGAIGWGYGVFHAKGQTLRAHRFSWELHNGPICDGLQVLHKCDVRACVNPAHLFLGTQLENIQDMDAKGRRVTKYNPRRGETHADAKLTTSDIVAIRQLSAQGVSQREIAKQFDMSQQHISDIVRRRCWTHVP